MVLQGLSTSRPGTVDVQVFCGYGCFLFETDPSHLAYLVDLHLTNIKTTKPTSRAVTIRLQRAILFQHSRIFARRRMLKYHKYIFVCLYVSMRLNAYVLYVSTKF